MTSFSVVSLSNSNQEQRVIYTTPAASIALSQEMAAGLAEKAALGDGDAALALAEDALVTMKSADIRLHWMQIAAENGNISAMGALSGLYFRRGGRFHCLRSLYWLEVYYSKITPEERVKYHVDSEIIRRKNDLKNNIKCKGDSSK
ncbi:hypothetical protein [Niveispirillum lacus]|uniref:hypothetical protein n=1 Tax=Niveispirillum lacus TaxID=1981099 RepID=UPI001054671A|nr:hypothetical protein [Niveispirillum lacus]